MVGLARDHRLVVCVEDNGRVGGCGSTLLQLLNDEQVDTPFRQYGIPQEFLDHAKRDAILERIGLTAQALARGIVEDVTALDPGDRSDHPQSTSPQDGPSRHGPTAVRGTDRPSRLVALAATLTLLCAARRVQRRLRETTARSARATAPRSPHRRRGSRSSGS